MQAIHALKKEVKHQNDNKLLVKHNNHEHNTVRQGNSEVNINTTANRRNDITSNKANDKKHNDKVENTEYQYGNEQRNNWQEIMAQYTQIKQEVEVRNGRKNDNDKQTNELQMLTINNSNTNTDLGGTTTQEVLHNVDKIILANKVVRSGKYNSDNEGLCIPLQSSWNINKFEQLLTDSNYHDLEVITHLKYGWPVNRDLNAPDPEPATINHKGVTEHVQQINNYLNKEIRVDRIVGPIDEIPFKQSRIGISPISS